jgi:predicted MFS family arabinose efflux permease
MAFALVARSVRESSNSLRKLDAKGQVLGFASLALLTYALIEGNNKGWTSPRIVVPLLAAVAAAASFVAVERRAPAPMVPFSVFREARFSVANAVAALVGFGLFGMLLFFSLFLQTTQGHSAIAAGTRFLPLTGALVVVAPLAGRIAARFGPQRSMQIGLGLLAAGLLLMEQITPGTGYAALSWRLLIIGLGAGLTIAPMTEAAVGAVAPARAGMASALVITQRQAGQVLGVAVFGAIVTARRARVLKASLRGLGVPVQKQAKIVALGFRGRARPGTLSPPVRHAVGDAFVSGMHTALLVAALAILLAFVLVVATHWRRDTPM